MCRYYSCIIHELENILVIRGLSASGASAREVDGPREHVSGNIHHEE